MKKVDTANEWQRATSRRSLAASLGPESGNDGMLDLLFIQDLKRRIDAEDTENRTYDPKIDIDIYRLQAALRAAPLIRKIQSSKR